MNKATLLKRLARRLAVIVLIFPLGSEAGDLNPPNPNPDAAAGAMFTLEAIYQRLLTGAAGMMRGMGFVEPAAGPGSTGHTLNEVMAIAPVADDTNGAITGDVRTGKTFWGLNVSSGQWGPQTGAAAEGNNVDGADGAKTFPIPDGFYSGKSATANDSDLLPANIADGVDLFGVVGTLHGGCSCSGTLSPLGRWCDNGNGTVTDLNNCLVWLKDSGCAGEAPWVEPADGVPAGAHTRASNLFDGATAFSGGDCNLSDGSTQGDWRLPTRNELRALVNGPEAVRTATPRLFTGVVSAVVWSSTSFATLPASAWGVLLSGGVVGADVKFGTRRVWPVRGGQ